MRTARIPDPLRVALPPARLVEAAYRLGRGETLERIATDLHVAPRLLRTELDRLGLDRSRHSPADAPPSIVIRLSLSEPQRRVLRRAADARHMYPWAVAGQAVHQLLTHDLLDAVLDDRRDRRRA
ncbi:hypothetical protein ACQVP2_07575 [Methylobacterium aquaticum]|uniref:hypothetical protein n=1 Tax=Methylobacterium aquaticum TaxID=270351 RepID=UPI003D16A684